MITNIDVVWLISSFHHVWCWIVAYLEWLINLNLKLKLESKDSLLDDFRQKQTLQAKSLACLGVG
jgi:hypothetical protein